MQDMMFDKEKRFQRKVHGCRLPQHDHGYFAFKAGTSQSIWHPDVPEGDECFTPIL